jgi:hypothetical protein
VVDPSEDAGDLPFPLAEAEADWHWMTANLQISTSSSGDLPFSKFGMEEDGLSSTCLIAYLLPIYIIL